jgi:putative NADPH-quinone reductase
LSKGYREVKELEPDLKKAQEDILWADSLVFVFPMWWYSFPAILKGFIDRIFLPSFAFKYSKNGSNFPDKLLKGKKSFLICTSGGPNIYYFFIGNLATKTLKRMLAFCGIKNKKTILFGSSSGDPEKINLDKHRNKILIESIPEKMFLLELR